MGNKNSDGTKNNTTTTTKEGEDDKNASDVHDTTIGVEANKKGDCVKSGDVTSDTSEDAGGGTTNRGSIETDAVPEVEDKPGGDDNADASTTYVGNDVNAYVSDGDDGDGEDASIREKKNREGEGNTSIAGLM